MSATASPSARNPLSSELRGFSAAGGQHPAAKRQIGVCRAKIELSLRTSPLKWCGNPPTFQDADVDVTPDLRSSRKIRGIATTTAPAGASRAQPPKAALGASECAHWSRNDRNHWSAATNTNLSVCCVKPILVYSGVSSSSQGKGLPRSTSRRRYRKVSFSPLSRSMVRMYRSSRRVWGCIRFFSQLLSR